MTLPHCFNARDSWDPDTRCYQGPGWYRKPLTVASPFPNGRTRLHFDGASSISRWHGHRQGALPRLFNPAGWSDQSERKLEITDPSAKIIHSASQALAPWSGDREINRFEIAKPEL